MASYTTKNLYLLVHVVIEDAVMIPHMFYHDGFCLIVGCGRCLQWGASVFWGGRASGELCFFCGFTNSSFSKITCQCESDLKKGISGGHKEVSTNGASHVLGQYKRKLGGVGNMWDDQRSAEHAMPQRPVYALCPMPYVFSPDIGVLLSKH